MANKQTNVIVSGFGGQGVLFLGTILANAAMIEEKNTTWIPSYGAEMRGGSANCYVVISNDEIASPIFDEADYGIFLSKQAYERFENSVKKEGLILANSSMTGESKNRENVEYLFKPFNELIFEKNKKYLLNIVALGTFIKKTEIFTKNSVIEALKKVSSAKRPEFLDLNLQSFEFGYSLI